jgi:hypothetical protein
MVKVTPNMAVVNAKIRDIKDTEEPNVFDVNLDVLSSEPISGYEDFVSRFVGKTIKSKLLLKKKPVSDDDTLKLVIKYEGDEHGGSYYAQESDCL